MLTVSYEFYTDTYGGYMPEEQFKKQLALAVVDIDYYTNYSLEKLTDETADANLLYSYRCLCCILADQKETDAQNGDKIVKRLSSGKVSEEYLESSLPRNRGVEEINLIEKYLSRWGYCCRWV